MAKTVNNIADAWDALLRIGWEDEWISALTPEQFAAEGIRAIVEILREDKKESDDQCEVI